ncbi:hypothetical protein ABZ366_26635, partial [Streptomyces sp. NPDC005904]
GLRQVESDAYFPLASPACAALETATLQQLRPDLIAAGLATPDDIDAAPPRSPHSTPRCGRP